MIDYQQIFNEMFEKGKRILKRDGKLLSIAYLLQQDGSYVVIPMSVAEPQVAGHALCMTAGLTQAAAIIWLCDAWLRQAEGGDLKAYRHFLQNYRYGDVQKSPDRQEALYAIFYSPDMTFVRVQPYKRVHKTIMFQEARDTAESGHIKLFTTSLFPWWDGNQKASRA